jgi:hypothetical protein
MTEFFLNIKLGQVDNRETLRKNLASLPDGNYIVTIKATKRRSLSQNAYIHGVLFPEALIALREAGYDEIRTVEHAKRACKYLFLKKQIFDEETGEVKLEWVKDTSELTKAEMSEFIESVIRWLANDFHHVVPPPNTQTSAF